ncbi:MULTISPECIES: 1-phosphofructokinase [Cyanophyceae]|uniref:1-phosphofructokinase n=1 Tax=Leptolyngbya subtilissima DQ-A4 TaxID=2933933 RepID=A0ABV0KBM2_9CYAN|nr:1-phosphofructokinase [Nodosilinea sp. FACHB-141]MBD2113688.1 1-phosphofructokinase [Nodosilinea sp. FACHB-141]
MTHPPRTQRIATVTLNPAIDQTVSIPNFQADVVNRVDWKQDDAGGKGVNVASFLAEAGHRVRVTGFLGRQNSTLFKTLFLQKGIDDHFVYLPSETRVNIKIVDDAQGQVTDINYPGQSPTRQDVDGLRKVVQALAESCDWFVFSGSVPAGLSTDIYDELIGPLKAQGKTVILDTSGDALRFGLPGKPDLIKPNRVELEEVLNTRLESHGAIVAAARELIGSGIPYVVVSMGGEGALFIDRTQAFHAQPPAVEIKSTVGAGDAMVAGTVAGLLGGEPLRDCATLATAFSMGALGQIGPRLPPMKNIQAMRKLVTVQEVR